MDRFLLEIIVCPMCKGKLFYKQEQQELICKSDALAYPIFEGIPVLLESKARIIKSNETY